MSRLRRTIAVTLALALPVMIVPTAAAAAPMAGKPAADTLGVYVGTLDAAQLDRLRATGADLAESPPVPVAAAAGKRAGEPAGAVRVEAVLGAIQAEKLLAAGVPLTPKATTATMRARAEASPTVFRRYAGAGGLRAELAATAAANPGLAKLVTIGHSLRGQPIQAVKVTRGARTLPDGARPAVLYGGAQHAREWITPEMVRRLMHHVLDGYRTDPVLTRLLDTTELWFLPVLNPDGYDFTFTGDNRFWRKNLRDNDRDGEITLADGVDLNRNYPEKWGYDEEGSSSAVSSETYRGAAPASEPETRAMDQLFRRIGFAFFVNYHSAAQLLLYGVGWQVSTPSPDDQIALAMAGDDAHPAVPGYDPDISAELYTTNGDTDFHAQARYGTTGFTPEMSTCEAASEVDPADQWDPADCISEFAFPDDEKLVAGEVAKNLPFALSVARSAVDPAHPVSSVGRTTPDLVADPFAHSYGTRQTVSVTARRGLRGLTMHYRIGSGPERVTAVREWRGGERYGDQLTRWYAEFRGTVPRQRPGDRVTVWFTGGPSRTEPFTYTVADQLGADVLVLAAEDVTGISPPTTDGATAARYAGEYVASLRRAGYSADVYDMDTHGRAAPHPLGVLSHYRTVVWETGDDLIPRAPGQPAGTVARSALETELAVRDYLNEGGKLLLAGKYAGYAPGANGSYVYQPDGPGECTASTDPTCLPLLNDFQQYWLGAYAYVDAGGSVLTGEQGRYRGFTGTVAADAHTASLLSTSSFLPPRRFPQFASEPSVAWQIDGPSPYLPIDGSWYLWSGQADASWKRLTRTVDLSAATSGRLRFRSSHDIEPDWDYLFIEARPAGTDRWTTLPEANGHAATGTGDSCTEGVATLHPFLAHYQNAACEPTGTTGSWHAATGNSDGWQEWDVDLSAYAGQQVEISISYMSDWGTQGLGVFLDDVRVEVGGTTQATSFETDLGGWTVAAPPPGTGPNVTDWTRSQQAFQSAALVTTRDTAYAGFGLESLGQAERDDLIRRVMRQLEG